MKTKSYGRLFCVNITIRLIQLVGLMLLLDSRCYAQKNIYELVKCDSLTIRKYCKTDAPTSYVKLKDQLVYYSHDSNCIILSHLKTKVIRRVNFVLPAWQYQFYLKPYMVNFGQLDDSTLVAAYESRNPYAEEKIFLLNVNSATISFPFRAYHPDLVSKYDTTVKEFNEAQKRFRTWFAVSHYELQVRAEDTTVFMPVYTGDISVKDVNNLRSHKNAVITIGTFKSKVLEVVPSTYMSLSNRFKDSFSEHEDYYKLANSSVNRYGKHSVLISFRGLNDVIVYNTKTESSSVIKVGKAFADLDVHTAENVQLKLNNLLEFWHFSGPLDNEYYIRGITVPEQYLKQKVSGRKYFNHHLYDSKLKYLGYFKGNVSEMYIRGFEGNKVIGYNAEASMNNDSFFFYYLYDIRKVGKVKQLKTVQELAEETIVSDKRFNHYLADVSPGLLLHDTILFIDNSNNCPMCLFKVVNYIRALQDSAFSHKPYIVSSKSIVSHQKLITYYGLKGEGVYCDSIGWFEKTGEQRSMGMFVKQGECYVFQPFDAKQLNAMMRILHPRMTINRERICIPLRD